MDTSDADSRGGVLHMSGGFVTPGYFHFADDDGSDGEFRIDSAIVDKDAFVELADGEFYNT